MRITIAGGHGKIARLLTSRLIDEGHKVVSLVRNPDHAAAVEKLGATAQLLDLEDTNLAALATEISDSDAVVFAAGAGSGSGAERKLTLDRDGAVLLADAALAAGVRRYILVSARRADDFDPDSDDVFQVYLRAKSEADAAVRERDLDWTIIRPGALTDDEATGAVTVGDAGIDGSIPRADVAHLIAVSITEGEGIGAQFEVVSGDTPIGEAWPAKPQRPGGPRS